MLTIRNEQMQAFQRASLERFSAGLSARFAVLWPEQASELGEGYRQFIESTIGHAISYGIETESAIARFVNLCFIWGPDFERRPEHAWAMRILQDSNMHGPAKVRDLVFRTKLKLQAMEANTGLEK